MGAMFRKQKQNADLSNEVREHLALAEEEHVRRGLSPEAARYAARRDFGGVEQHKELYRDRRGLPVIETFLQDLRFGARMLRKNPGFTAVAILTLALGIGANTAIFSIVNSVVLRPLPFPNAKQLVYLSEKPNDTPPNAQLQGLQSYVTFKNWQSDLHSFSAMGAYQYLDLTLTGRGSATALQGAMATAGFFITLDARPILGRALQAGDEVKGAQHVVVVSEWLWRGQLGADPQILGQTIKLDSDPFLVVGVMPASFRYPDQTPPCAFWIPVPQAAAYATFVDVRAAHFLAVIGRMKPEVKAAQAQAEVNILDQQVIKQNGLNADVTVHVASLQRYVVGNTQPVLLILLGAVGFVVLIACANIANLLLARATGRSKEIAVRIAIGAGRSRVFRQLLTESVLLGICAGAIGLLLAFFGVAGIKALADSQLPHVVDMNVDASVLAFTFALSITAGVLFGLAPAWQSSAVDLNDALRESSRGTTGGVKRRWTRNALVVAEVAIAVVLLVGSGLLLKSFYLLTRVKAGFDSGNLLTAVVTLPQSQYKTAAQWNGFFREATEQLKVLPGVEDAAAALPIPFVGSTLKFDFTIVGAPPFPPGKGPIGFAHTVTPNYLHVLRIPLIGGRDFNEGDTAPNAARVVIISQNLARQYFPNQDPIGQSLIVTTGSKTGQPSRIIGITGDIKDKSLDEAPSAMMYFPYTQDPWWVMYVVIRTSGDPTTLASALQSQIQKMDPSLPVQDILPMSSRIASSHDDARISSMLLGMFAALALVLASVGIYGVLAYVVAQRTHEIGIRLALGAQRGDVLRLVIAQGMRSVFGGIAIGVGGALAMSQVLADLLYSVSAKDPATFIVVAAVLSVVALLACYIPARRAMRVDPMVALRYQ
jgi:predicted permease